MTGASSSSDRVSLKHVCLVIATFRQDEAVLRLLETAYEGRQTHRFASILVVDSMGSTALERAIKERGWRGISYRSFDTNLGSAGNLAMRLQLAAQTQGAQWAYALNHDGELRWDTLEALVRYADHPTTRPFGALYPLRYTPALGKYNLTGTSRQPIPYVGTTRRPKVESFRVFWASSNGALYHLDPVREGLSPRAELWMGWEDMGYGWQLEAHGWRQEVVCDALFEDDYEYVAHEAGQREVHLTDKPTWYAYYQIRNLILITRHNQREPLTWSVVLGRILLEYSLSLTLRKDRRRRLYFLTQGLCDGLLGRTGKWLYP